MPMVHNGKFTRYRRCSSRVYLTVSGYASVRNIPLTTCSKCDNLSSFGCSAMIIG